MYIGSPSVPSIKLVAIVQSSLYIKISLVTCHEIGNKNVTIYTDNTDVNIAVNITITIIMLKMNS